jgi:hypothetical protein
VACISGTSKHESPASSRSGFAARQAVWAHEVDIFRLIDPKDFVLVQTMHWRKLPYWIFAPVAFALAGGIALIWYHPAGSPEWAIWGILVCQFLAIILTAFFWGRWQAELSRDPGGSQSLYLERFLATHWIRTLLVTASAFILQAWVLQIVPTL